MDKKFAIIGLGHFGTHLAVELAEKGAEVLAIDDNLERLEEIKDRVTHTVRLNATEEKALRSQGIQDFDAVVVGMGDDFEATLLTVAALQRLDVKRIIVRATTETHERILNHLGITEIILPTVEAAERLANTLLFERVVDSFELSSDFTIVEVRAPESFVGTTLRELNLQERFDVSLITIKRTARKKQLLGFKTREVETILGLPTASTVIERGDLLVVFGTKKAIQRLAEH
jgi:trk system potassium uptake protein TrkA